MRTRPHPCNGCGLVSFSKRDSVAENGIRLSRGCRLAHRTHPDTFAEASVLAVELDDLPNPLRRLLAISVRQLLRVGLVDHQPLVHTLKQHDVLALGGADFLAQLDYLDLANFEPGFVILDIGNAEVLLP